MSTIKVSNLQHASAASPAIVLDANSRATLNGLSYPTEGSLSGRNRIINGDMRIDQRNAGASVTPTSDNQYTLDRYEARLTQSSKFSVQRSTTAPNGFTNSLLVTSLSAYSVTSSDRFAIGHRIEGYNSADLAWGTASAQAVTLSFWVRSSLTGTFGGSIANLVGDQFYVFSYSISSANTWEYKTITVPGATAATWNTDNTLGINIRFGLGAGTSNSGTAGSWGSTNYWQPTGSVSVVGTNGATFYITGVQLEAGSVATPFERRSYGQELALCQRYYWRNTAGAGYTAFGVGTVSGSNNVSGVVCPLPVAMRATPTVSISSNIRILNGNNAVAASTSIGYQASSPNVWAADIGTTSSTMTIGQAGVLQANNNTSAYIDASAEL